MQIIKGPRGLFAASFVFLFGLGCGGTQQPDATPPVTIATTSPSVAPSVETPGPAETAGQEKPSTSSRANRCAPDGAFPPLAPRPQPAAPLPCRPAEVVAEKMITSDMIARYQVTKDRHTVEVKFGCDALDRVISRIVLETGGGHNGTLNIIEISRSDPNAVNYGVLGVKLSPSMMGRPKSPFEIMLATLSQETVYALTPVIRAALRTTIEEVESKTIPKTKSGGGSAHGSTAGIHIVVRLEDISGRVMEKHYTGYESSLSQSEYLPLVRAQEELERAIAGSGWHVDSPPDEIKHFFDRTFIDARERFSDSAQWWVRERYVKLAAHVATRALIPVLVPLLTPIAGNASSIRTRDQAFEALVALTGWEPRAPKDGEHPRTIEAAANDFIVECGKVPTTR